MIEAATNLRIVSQVYNATDNANDITFAWERGFSDEANIVTQFVDVTLFPFDFTCGEPARICFDAGGVTQQVTLGGIGFAANHGWRVNTLFRYSDLSEVWAPSPNVEFLSASAPARAIPTGLNLLPIFTSPDRALVLPNNPSSRSLLPYFAPLVPSDPNGPTPPSTPPTGGPPSINGDPLLVARLAIQYWNRSQAIQMVAIAGAESGFNSGAQGDDWRNFPNQGSITQEEKDRACNFYWSHGLWQVNMNAHYVRLQQLTGSNNPCDWATWLHNPSNNTFIANEISSGGTYLVPWTMYLRGAQHLESVPHHTDGGTCYIEYLGVATQAVDQALAEQAGFT